MSATVPVTVLRVVRTAADIPPAVAGTLVLVLDPAFTPPNEGRDDLRGAREVLGSGGERIDLYDDALDRVDRWADDTSIADRLLVEGVTYWFRLRETSWRWVHERLLWRYGLAALDPDRTVRQIHIPAGATALADVAGAWLPGGELVIESGTTPVGDAPARPATPARATGSLPARLGALLRRLAGRIAGRGGGGGGGGRSGDPAAAERARRNALLDRRVATIRASEQPIALVLTDPKTYHRIGGPDGTREDPLFGTLLRRLPDAGFTTVRFGSYVDHRRDEGWALAADDELLLPQSMLTTRWARPGDDARPAAALAALEPTLAALPATTLDLDGLDLGPAFGAMLAGTIRSLVPSELGRMVRIERLLEDLRPSVVVLAQEGIRTGWLVAARARGIPVVAVQHGVLYEGHPGYAHQRHPAHVRATVTCVYGPAEAEVLLRRGAYVPDEVEVTGSPRLDLDAAAPTVDRAAERAALRAELGVAETDQLLVVSTVNLAFVQGSHFACGLSRTLGGPLPGVHVVFKLHPGESDEGPYRALLGGLAAVGGYPAPPIGVVKDIDLFRLLRGADAHIGMLSTVLTDATAAGTGNLIVMTDRHADLLGYVDAGVAVPVRSVDDVRAALAGDLRVPQERREAFLARHFRAGDATARLLDVVTRLAGAGVAR